ncbi:GNAT family N-acetyltransferase [Paenibacillus sp. P96]|uniref:GNAT family N-acetyltransferase n=1 Tax=Paenibacillus zeirhizosphaerae TaxID=2987519 RepID=A0ABT9FTW6_9BACL|nr:GNAT family N-acetyltransferase [Paenibacillus sp. P96]MDP4098158.1 GNAT family N-acetyltransferase [Paenibacillus sp. P96]
MEAEQLKLITLDRLDEKWWPEARLIYHQSFEHGRKPDRIIKQMFDRKLSLLHVVVDKSAVAAMAITGKAENGKALIIDYLAVKEEYRGQGLGEWLVKALASWASSELQLEELIIEVESEQLPENDLRKRFWQKCGFRMTDYVHTYKWIPETYQAMYFPLTQASSQAVTEDGRALFKQITAFHHQSFR